MWQRFRTITPISVFGFLIWISQAAAQVHSDPQTEASIHQKSFRVHKLPVTFRYPNSWSEPLRVDSMSVVRGPLGFNDEPLEIRIHAVRKSQHPGSSAWKQVIRAQDQLTSQDGLLLVMEEGRIGDRRAPFVLVGFPLGGEDEGRPVFNVLQFVVDYGDSYCWICFCGPSDAWEANARTLAAIRDSIRFEQDTTAVTGEPSPAGHTATSSKWTADRIRRIRKVAANSAEVPENAPEGWSKSMVDPTKLVKLFEPLRLKEGMRLRAFQFRDDIGNGNGFVWAMPASAEFPEPEDCPVAVTHFLQPPKPPAALDDFMEAIEGDGTPDSYLAASLLARQLREFGAMWHGMEWTMHVVYDADPWKDPPAEEEEPLALIDRPQSTADEFQWIEERPTDWRPRVEITKDSIRVTYYTYCALEMQRIYRHVDHYRPGNYRFTTLRKVVAEAEGGVAF